MKGSISLYVMTCRTDLGWSNSMRPRCDNPRVIMLAHVAMLCTASYVNDASIRHTATQHLRWLPASEVPWIDGVSRNYGVRPLRHLGSSPRNSLRMQLAQAIPGGIC